MLLKAESGLVDASGGSRPLRPPGQRHTLPDRHLGHRNQLLRPNPPVGHRKYLPVPYRDDQAVPTKNRPQARLRPRYVPAGSDATPHGLSRGCAPDPPKGLILADIWASPAQLAERRTLISGLGVQVPRGAPYLTWDCIDSRSFFVLDLSGCWLRARSRVFPPGMGGCQNRVPMTRPLRSLSPWHVTERKERRQGASRLCSALQARRCPAGRATSRGHNGSESAGVEKAGSPRPAPGSSPGALPHP